MMKKLFFAALLLCISAAAQAQFAGWGPQSRVVTDSINSKCLGAWRAYTVYLPKSYDADTARQYPVLYLLHGMFGTNRSWFDDQRCKDVADQLMASGEADEMIIVSPNAGGNIMAGAWNGYFNMPDWPYEDFFYHEFVPYIEKTYRVKADKEHRAIAGLSMGGGGTVSYAQRHSQMFCAAYALSALVNIPAGNENPSEDKTSKISLLTQSVMEHSCIAYVENATDEQKSELKSVRWFIDCGDDDFLLDRNIEFFHAMRAAGVPCEFRVRDGGHTSEYWHSGLYNVLRFVSRCFE